MAEAAAEATDQHQAEAQQAVGQGADIHQVGGEDEERDRQQYVAVEQAVEQLLRRGAGIEAGQQQVKDGGQDHRMADRQAHESQRDDGDDGDCERAHAGRGPRRASQTSQT